MSDNKRSYKAPPAFEEGDNYVDWKLDIDLWQEFTTIEKKKQGTALLLELKEGKVKNAVRSLGKTVLTAEDGMTKIIEQLDKIYEEDTAQVSYRAYCKFEKYERPESMNLQSYMSEFEKMLADLKTQKIVLPEAVVAYRFLNSANLPPERVDLALATVKELTYKEMSITIGKIFSVKANTTALDAVTTEPNIKVESEECNYTSYRKNSYNSGYRGTARGPIRVQRSNHYRGNYHPYSQNSQNHPYNRDHGLYRTHSQSGCYVCNEKGHYARECPKRSNVDEVQYFAQSSSSKPMYVEETSEDVYIALYTFPVKAEDCLMDGHSKPDLGALVFESLACAVIDSGCTRTVVGRSWLNSYYDTLDEKQKKHLVIEKCCTPFRFGDGEEIISQEKVKIPGRIGSHNILIDSNVVDCELPLLLSKPSLKKAGAVIDFLNDKMMFNGEEVDLFETKSGHYCVPICNKRKLVSDYITDDKKPQLVLSVSEETLFGQDDNEIKKKAMKLHRQFSHAPGYKLKSLLKKAGFEKEKFLKAVEEVSDNCEICIRYKKPKPRPVVGLPRGQTFNDTVAMDLKTVDNFNNVYFIHMIDTVTRYSAAMGRTPSLPNVVDDRLPAMEEGVTVSKVVADNVQAMHKAREEFAKCESSQKIKRALKSQIRTCNDEYFDNGEKVFYKRKNSNKWHGPGTVIGRESQCILVKHGVHYIKVHHCHISRVPKSYSGEPKQDSVESNSSKATTWRPDADYLDIGTRDENTATGNQEYADNANGESAQVDGVQVGSVWSVRNQPSRTTATKALPKPKTHVMFLPKYPEEDSEGVWNKAYIHSRGGKATEGDTEVQCVDWKEVATDWKEELPTEEEEEVLLSTVGSYDQSVLDAKLLELEKFQMNNVYDEVEDRGQSTVGVRWVVTRKVIGNKVKARLVALGYQENSSEIRKDSPM